MSTATVKATGRPLAIGMQYIGAAIVWGASFLFIKVAVGGLSPAQVVLGRLLGGAVLLAAIMLMSRRQWPRGVRTWAHLFAIGVLMCVAPFLLFSWAAQYLPSGLSSIFNAATPIATMIIALAVLPEERLTKVKTYALFIAAGGIALVLGPWRIMAEMQDASLLPQLACLAGTACYGLGFTYTRRFFRTHDYDSTAVVASQIGAGAIVILALAPFIGRGPVELSPGIVASVLLLGAVGTGLAYIWHTNVINAWGATTASTVTYLTPVTGVLLGVLILGEEVLWHEVAGGAVVVLAVLVSQGRLPLLRGRGASTAGGGIQFGHERSSRSGGPPRPEP